MNNRRILTIIVAVGLIWPFGTIDAVIAEDSTQRINSSELSLKVSLPSRFSVTFDYGSEHDLINSKYFGQLIATATEGQTPELGVGVYALAGEKSLLSWQSKFNPNEYAKPVEYSIAGRSGLILDKSADGANYFTYYSIEKDRVYAFNSSALNDDFKDFIDSFTTTKDGIITGLLNLFSIPSVNAYGPFVLPTYSNYTLTCSFSCYSNHNGTDYGTPNNTAVAATYAGEAFNYVYSGTGYGRLIAIKHEGGFRTRYAHLASSVVNNGQTVARGQQIGYSGNSGGPWCQAWSGSTCTQWGSPYHLHFETRIDAGSGNELAGSPVDPYSGSNYLWTTSPPSVANSAPVIPFTYPTPDVGYNEDGRMVVGMRGNSNQVFIAEQYTPNGSWGGWIELVGETFSGNIKFGRNLDKRVQLFANKNFPGTSANSISTRWQTSTNGQFNGPSSSSFLDLQGMMISDPSVVSNQNGTIQFFTVHHTGSVYMKYQTVVNGGFSGWVGLEATGVQPLLDSTQNNAGGLYVSVLGGDGIVYYRRQTTPNNNSSWTTWLNFGGSGIVGKPIMTKDASGRVRVIVRGGNNKLYHQWETSAGSNVFSGWYLVAGDSVSPTDPAVGVYNGQLYVFHRGTDGNIWYSRETSTNTWTSWQHMNAYAITSVPAVGVNQNGLLTVFVRGSDGVLYQKKQTGTDSWEVWTNIGDLNPRF
jgi:murein DD-endopeptidase MepM/ murein hydrolase activator NlpD